MQNAIVVQLVVRRLAKAKIAGSSPVYRSLKKEDTRKGWLLFFKGAAAPRRFECLRSAPVGAALSLYGGNA